MIRILQPNSFHLVHTYEFELMLQGDYQALPGSVVIVIPNNATHEQRLEFHRIWAAALAGKIGGL